MSPSTKFTVFGIVVILGLSYLGCLDSHVIILVGYISDLLRIPMEFLLGYQDESDIFDVTLGHISLL